MHYSYVKLPKTKYYVTLPNITVPQSHISKPTNCTPIRIKLCVKNMSYELKLQTLAPDYESHAGDNVSKTSGKNEDEAKRRYMKQQESAFNTTSPPHSGKKDGKHVLNKPTTMIRFA